YLLVVKKIKLLATSSLAFSLFLLGLSQAPAKGFTLDAFSDVEDGFGQSVFANFDGPPFFFPDVTSNVDTGLDNTVVGGRREIQITENAGSNTILFSINTINEVADLQVGNATTATATIIWEGLDLAGGVNDYVDITDNNGEVQNSIQLNISELNIGNEVGGGTNDLNFTFEFKDQDDNKTSITNIITSSILAPGKSIYFSYQDRVEDPDNDPTKNGGITNLERIDYIRFYTSDENNGDDFTFDFVQTSETIPFKFNPTLGIIIGSGLVGLNIIKKARNK
ncbi:MAG: hypothetical protein AAGA80_24760, partial [Cyanobacteria bacterium P01_F01_bin.143]